MMFGRLMILGVGCSLALAAPGLARTVTVGTAPLVHPSGGQYAGRLNIAFTEGWWDESHSGQLEGSGFTWVYEPVDFGEGLSKTFKIDNVFEPNLTKVMTITLKARANFVIDPGERYCIIPVGGSCRNAPFWPTSAAENLVPFALKGAANLAYDEVSQVWTGQFQFSQRPQPAAEYVSFGRPSFPVDLVEVVSMELEVSCIPEPASWGMMLAGFGVVGVSARRRRRSEAAPARG